MVIVEEEPRFLRPLAHAADDSIGQRRNVDLPLRRAEERPDADMSERAVAFHEAVTGAHAAILMRDTGKQMRA